MNVPAGWESAPLGAVCQVVSGATPKTSVPSYWGGDIPWVTPADMSRDRSQYMSHGERFLTQEGLESCSARVFSAGSVIYSSRAPIGYVAIAARPMATNQGCKTAVPPDEIDPKYLYWYLISRTPEIQSRASGTTFKEISAKSFGKTQLHWPDLPEQRRIVEILEEHLSRLDATAEQLNAIKTKADGWLRAVVDRQVWSDPSIPRVAVSMLLREPMRNGHSARASRTGEGVRALTLTAVTRRTFTNAFTKIVDVAEDRVRSLWLERDDIFVQRSNTRELVGTTARYTGPPNWAIFPDLLIRLRVDEARVTAGYLEAALRAERTHRALRSQAKGLAGSMPKVDQAAIGGLMVPVPALVRQREVTGQVQTAEEAQVRVHRECATAVQRAESLRKALLAAAFSGRLTGAASDMDRIEELAGV